MQSPKLSVYVTVPLPVSYEDQFLHRDVAHWLIAASHDPNFDVTVNLPTGFPVEDNRNRTMKRFLDGGFDFWLSVDSDNPPTVNVLNYAFLDKDIVGFPTPVFRWKKTMMGEPPIHFNAYDYVQSEDGYVEHKPREGLQRVDAIGSGCFLMARRVAEHKSLRRHAWQRTYDKDGFVEKGSDLAFCERARIAGFEIWAAYDAPADHVKGCSLNMMWQGFHGAFDRWVQRNQEKARGEKRLELQS